MRLAIVYDCIYPNTVGGAERWYRGVAERLAADEHEVTYLTLRQWARGDLPEVPGVDVVAVGPRMALYAASGRRRILPPLVFGAGVLAHLLAAGGRYDAVHTASFPYFPLLAAAAVRPLRRFRLVVDWFEVWTREYWRNYLGRVSGLLGWAVQRLCVTVSQHAFCFSALHAQRLREDGFSGELTVLEGMYAGSTSSMKPSVVKPLVVFAGRHIPEKRVPTLVDAMVHVRRRLPELRCLILGDGPDRPEVLRRIRASRLEDVVSAPGFVSTEHVEEALASALCLALPSVREGYGLVVIEAASYGTPSVVVAAPDNAAVELVQELRNGAIAPSASAADLAAAIVRIHDAGPALRNSTTAWFGENARRLSLADSLERVSASYGAGRSANARS